MPYIWTMIKVCFGFLAILTCVVALPWATFAATLPSVAACVIAVVAIIAALCIAA